VTGVSDALVFIASALGIIPTAALIGRATEENFPRDPVHGSAASECHLRQRPELIIALFASAGPPRTHRRPSRVDRQ
jgi:Ca2+:H+ antiporter